MAGTLETWLLNPAVFYPLIVWSIFWKGMALWHSARGGQLTWFIALLVLQTMGILEIIYLIFFRRKLRF